MGKLLDKLPWWADVLLPCLLVGGLWAAKTGYDRHQQGIGAERVQARWNADKVVQQQAALKAQADSAAETQRRIAAQQEIANEATAQLNRARADADAARSAGDRLRAQLAAYVSANRGAASSNPAPQPGGATTSTPLDLLADMFRDSDEAAGILAAALDSANAAGLACERAYDSLTSANSTRPAN